MFDGTKLAPAWRNVCFGKRKFPSISKGCFSAVKFCRMTRPFASSELRTNRSSRWSQWKRIVSQCPRLTRWAWIIYRRILPSLLSCSSNTGTARSTKWQLIQRITLMTWKTVSRSNATCLLNSSVCCFRTDLSRKHLPSKTMESARSPYLLLNPWRCMSNSQKEARLDLPLSWGIQCSKSNFCFLRRPIFRSMFNACCSEELN